MQSFTQAGLDAAQDIKILYVEGDPSEMRLMEKILAGEGACRFVFDAANTLGQSLEFLSKNSYDLILLNLFLPDCQGLETLSKILTLAPHEPILILSDKDDESLAVQAIKLGAQDFLIKADMNNGQFRRVLFHAALRKRVDANLRKNHKDFEQIRLRYHAVLRSTTQGLCMLNTNWVIIFHNHAFTNIFCADPTRSREYEGYSFGDLFPTDEAFNAFKSYATESIRSAASSLVEVQMMDFDNNLFWAEISIVRTDPSETASGFVVTISDVTKRREAEYQLRKAHNQMEAQVRRRTAALVKANKSLQNEITIRNQMTEELHQTRIRLEFILSNSPAVIYTSKSYGDYAVSFVSRNVKSILGYEPEDFTGKADFWKNHIHPDDIELVLKEAPRVFEKGYHVLEYRFRLPDGRFRWIRDESRLTKEDEGFPIEIIGFWVDITARKKAEDKVQKYQEHLEELVRERTKELSETNKQLHDLSQHLMVILENERKSISREIHDDLGQRLTALKMDMVWCKNKAPVSQAVAERVDCILVSIDELIKAVQNISRKIRPGILDDLGLVDAMDWEAKEFERRSGIRVITNLESELVVEPELSTTLFRIFQELLTNVARHSKATEVFITLKQESSTLNLIVEDNGIGITKDKIKNVNSLGLLSIRERLHAWQGELDIIGADKKGTRVHISIPLSGKSTIQGE